jgi:glucokinase
MFADLRLADLDRDHGAAAIGVDVGGTKTALGLIDAGSLTLLATEVIATGRERGGEAVLADVARHAATLAGAAARQDRRVVGVGVAVPEIVNLAGQITSSAVIPRWNELPVAATLGTIAPTVIEADVRAAAFAEAALGAGRGYPWHVFLTVGTGISYCAVGDGRPLAGAHGGALNVGTSVLDLAGGHPAPDHAADGQAGGEYDRDGHVLERVASGSALVQRFNQRGGSARGAQDVLAAARLGDQAARDVVDTGARALGIGIALLVNLLDPQAVIVGGGLGSADTEYWVAAQRWGRHYAHSFAAGTVLARSELGPDAGVIGAGLVGLLARRRHRHGASSNRASSDRASSDRAGPNRATPARGTPDQGTPDQGTPDQGTPDQGIPDQGIPDQGIPDQGTPDQGTQAAASPNSSATQRK